MKVYDEEFDSVEELKDPIDMGKSISIDFMIPSSTEAR